MRKGALGMAYAKLLSDIIAEAGLSINEVAEKCAEYGEAISASYISALKHEKKSPPTDKVSRALAKACGQPENLLVIEAYIENAPVEFKPVFDLMHKTIILVLKAATAFPFSFTKKAWGAKLDNLTLAALIQVYNQQQNKIEETPNDPILAEFKAAEHDADITNKDPIIMPDDSMSPLIPQGSEVIFETFFNYQDYKNGDIICYQKNGRGEEIYVRQFTFLDDGHTQIVASAHNNQYKPEFLNMDDLLILGKATGVSIKLK